MNCQYVRDYYGVPAEIGRRVTYKGKPGVIYKDGGNYIAVNFDEERPGDTVPIHPTDKNLVYLDEVGKVRRMTKSQKRYKRYLEFGDGFDSFIDFCRWDAAQSKGE